MIRFLMGCWLVICWTVTAFSQTAAREGYISAGRLRLHYRLEGAGNAVLLLHGGYLDLHAWDAEAAWLSRSFTVVRIDLPGHGLSVGSDTSLLIADALHLVLDSLQIARTSVMGLSLGASCSVEFALAYPHSVDRLILVAPGLSGWAGVMKMDPLSAQLFTASDSISAGHNPDSIAENFTRLWCDGPYRKPADMNPSIRAYVFNSVQENILHADRSWPVFNPVKAAPRLGRIDCPTLIFTGDKDLPFIDSAGSYYQQHIAGARLVSIRGVAHMINLEQPEQFQKIVSAFLKGN